MRTIVFNTNQKHDNINNGAEYAPLALYVHIPFCVRKCRYCDFVSYAGCGREVVEKYVAEVCNEIEGKAAEYRDKYYVDTIFFGGGTPTFLDSEALIRMLKCIGENFVVGCINARTCGAGLERCDGLEISFEANPGTINREKLEALKASGFNRISIGVQSFDDKVLKNLGRIHNAKEAEYIVKLAKSLGFNTNLDLMFGVPGQSLEIWNQTLAKAVSLDPDHISFYSLQLEEETPLYKDYRFGNLSLPTWKENRSMYHAACDILEKTGYRHYEISNAAKPGFECRHNMKYWSMQDYLGFGPASHSYISGKRFYNSDELTGWTSCIDDNTDEKGDYLFTRLRLIEGFPASEYQERFGTDFITEFAGAFDPELLSCDGDMIHLTKKGLDYTNPVLERLLNKS